MIESERKFKLSIPASVATAAFAGTGLTHDERVQVDEVFCRDISDLLDPRPGTVVCRVRIEGARTLLAVKKRLQADLSRIEAETLIQDAQTGRDILTVLGYRHIVTVEKKRWSFRLDGGIATVDDVQGLGVFCEVEILSEDAGIAEQGLDELVRTVVDRLGRQRLTLETKAYDRLLAEKGLHQ